MASLKFLNPETGEYEKIGIPSPEIVIPETSGIQMELLWENPNPNAEFAAQTVEVNLNDCNFALVEFDYTYGICRIPTDGSSKLSVPVSANIWGTDNEWQILVRAMQASKTSVIFGEAYKVSGKSSTVSSIGNGAMKPYKIYGIKGVS